ncbi:MAG: TcpQ domain-containing protein [Aestuariivita sp.]|nr:TcpQ domain-containing protein [Aestuariivita sp.]
MNERYQKDTSWLLSYGQGVQVCQVIFFLALMSGAVSASPTSSGSAGTDPVVRASRGLIQCPDWQRYVSPVYLADATHQTNERFAAQTRRDTGVPRRKSSQDTAVQAASLLPQTACTYTIKQGDTLGKIAAATLGTATKWKNIATVNPGIQPKRLRVGATIQLPCAVTKPANTEQASDPQKTPSTTSARASSWWPFGQRSTPAADVPPKTPEAPAAPNVTEPVAPPLPIWEAKKGEYLADILRRWGKTAGYTVIVDTADAWKISVAIRLKAEFEAAVDELVSGLAHDGTPPRVRLYPNAVVRLGGPL